MTTATLPAPTAPDLRDLRDLIDGDVVLPGDPGWDAARQAWNLAADQRPAAVVFAASTADVVRVVELARTLELRVAPQGTGHFAHAMGPLDDAILLKTERMRGVEIDARERRARVEAGVLWQELADAAAEHGLAGLAGSSPDVGVVGYSLGGGMGWLARRYGLAANSVVAVELVTADGRLVRADADTEPDLFWAVRGGGGSFGVVTALEFALYPVRAVYAGVMFWPLARADEVLRAWRRWVDTVGDEVTSVGRLLRFPAIPELPEPLRGGEFVVVEVAFLGGELAGEELLAPLRELAPAIDTVATIPAAALAKVHMDPEGPAAGVGDGTFLDDFTSEAIDALVAEAGEGSGSPLVSVEVRHLGGALAEDRPGQGAVGSIEAGFAVYALGAAPTPAMAAAGAAASAAVLRALGPWEADRTYFNFTEREADGAELFPRETDRRLREVKAAYDPGERFLVAHAVRPAA